MLNRKKSLLILLCITFVVSGAVIIFWRSTVFPDDSFINASNTNKTRFPDQPIVVQKGQNSDHVTLPVKVNFDIPESLLGLTESQIAELNRIGYETPLSCGAFFEKTKKENGLWINYRTDSESCPEGTNLPSKIHFETALHEKPVGEWCTILGTTTQLVNCSTVTTTSGIHGVILTQFLRDTYSENDIGTVAQTAILDTQTDAGLLTVALIAPDGVQIKKTDFSSFVQTIQNSADPKVRAFLADSPLYRDLILSFSLQS